jgi:hypothetical protein
MNVHLENDNLSADLSDADSGLVTIRLYQPGEKKKRKD